MKIENVVWLLVLATASDATATVRRAPKARATRDEAGATVAALLKKADESWNKNDAEGFFDAVGNLDQFREHAGLAATQNMCRLATLGAGRFVNDRACFRTLAGLCGAARIIDKAAATAEPPQSAGNEVDEIIEELAEVVRCDEDLKPAVADRLTELALAVLDTGGLASLYAAIEKDPRLACPPDVPLHLTGCALMKQAAEAADIKASLRTLRSFEFFHERAAGLPQGIRTTLARAIFHQAHELAQGANRPLELEALEFLGRDVALLDDTAELGLSVFAGHLDDPLRKRMLKVGTAARAAGHAAIDLTVELAIAADASEPCDAARNVSRVFANWATGGTPPGRWAEPAATALTKARLLVAKCPDAGPLSSHLDGLDHQVRDGIWPGHRRLDVADSIKISANKER